MKSLVIVYVNDIPLLVPANSTALNAIERLGLVVPRFCYHELLEIAGNCRICVVEIEKAPKPIISCGLPVVNKIRIYTDTPILKKARESVIEFLLLNHPLDCPICDIGGQCDLQNQAMAYGNTISRNYIIKRSVTDKNFGPLIKTIISRCIHCTRCIRFASQIAGIEDFGITLRGNTTEVTTYVKKSFNSEISANVIDLCPVGALTSKVYAFKARPWEIKSTISIDTSDSLGSNISVESKNSKILRVLPRVNNKINNEWLSDKARYSFDANAYRRILKPRFKKSKNLQSNSQNKWLLRFFRQKFYKISLGSKKVYTFLVLLTLLYKINKLKVLLNPILKKTFQDLDSKIFSAKIFNFLIAKQKNFSFYLGRNTDIDICITSKEIVRKFGGDFFNESPFKLNLTFPCFFQSNKSLKKSKDFNSFIFLGVNPRVEASLANVHIRISIINKNATGLSLGPVFDLTYPVLSKSILPHKLIHIPKKDNVLVVFGESLSRRNDASSILINSKKTSKNLPSFIYLPLGSNFVGILFLGIYSNYKYEKTYDTLNLSYFFKVEESFLLKQNKTNAIIFENTTNSLDSNKINLCLPLQSDIEKTASFINNTGYLQKTSKILRFGCKPLIYFILFSKYKINKNKYRNLFSSKSSDYLSNLGFDSNKIKISKYPFKVILSDSIKSDNYLRQSLVLAKVSSLCRKEFFNFGK